MGWDIRHRPGRVTDRSNGQATSVDLAEVRGEVYLGCLVSFELKSAMSIHDTHLTHSILLCLASYHLDVHSVQRQCATSLT